jgi:sialic acid synthase SpsE
MVTSKESVVDIKVAKIGAHYPVFVIAEIGINHDGSVDKARELIKKAKEAGASSGKLQTYITEKRTSKNSPIFDTLKRCELTFEEQQQLFDYADQIGLPLFSTPFDDESVDFLNEMDVPCFKIASFDVVNTTLLKKVADCMKPVIISRGMCSTVELADAVSILKKRSIPYALMHCVSAYPVEKHSDCNLRTIRSLLDSYSVPVGFSDHTMGSEAAELAVATGATLIEKHVTLSRNSDGADHAFSMEFDEFAKMIARINYVGEILGSVVTGPIEAESSIMQFRRPT